MGSTAKREGNQGIPRNPTAEEFVRRLQSRSSPEEITKHQRYFKTGPGEYGEGDLFMGVRMGQTFALAKEFVEMTPTEIERLLESPIHEVRAGGLRIMDRQARRKRTPDSRRKELFELYVRRTDRINNWDLVDVCCPQVVGGYLWDRPRDLLFRWARSKNMWERRSAMVCTLFFAKRGDLDDLFKIAEMLLRDEQDLIHKATGWALRVAGDRDRSRMLAFLDRHAATMPRTALRYAIEHLDKDQRNHYLRL